MANTAGPWRALISCCLADTAGRKPPSGARVDGHDGQARARPQRRALVAMHRHARCWPWHGSSWLVWPTLQASGTIFNIYIVSGSYERRHRASGALLIADMDDVASYSGTIYLIDLANTAGQWHALIDCCGQHHLQNKRAFCGQHRLQNKRALEILCPQ